MRDALYYSMLLMQHGRAAAAKARAEGCSPYEIAAAQVGGTFREGYRHIDFKARLANRLLNNEPGDAAIRCRYVRRIETLARFPLTVDIALVQVRALYLEEKRKIKASANNWYECRRPPIDIAILAELYVMLLLCRRYAPQCYVAWRDAILGWQDWPVAA